MSFNEKLLQVKKKFDNLTNAGIDIPDHEYYSDRNAVSASQLKKLYTDGLSGFDYYMSLSNKQTQALIFGNVVHTHILEPDLFSSRYAYINSLELKNHITNKMTKEWIDKKYKSPEITKAYKEQKPKSIKEILKGEFTMASDVIGTNKNKWDGVLVIDEEDFKLSEKMKKAVYNCPEAVQMLNSSVKEKAFYSNILGIKCRGKIDIVGQNFRADLKTISDVPNPKNVRKAIYNYHYDLSEAMYAMLTGETNSYFIFVMKSAPFTVGVYKVSEELLESGLNKLESVLGMYESWLKDTNKSIPRYYKGLI